MTYNRADADFRTESWEIIEARRQEALKEKGKGGGTPTKVSPVRRFFQAISPGRLATGFELRKAQGKGKEKEKTRGVGDGREEVGEEQAVAAVVELPAKRVWAVDQRSLNVFHAILYTPGYRIERGEVRWTDFVYALAGIGFRFAQEAGSRVRLFPPAPSEEDRIVEGMDRPFGYEPGSTVVVHSPHSGRTGWPWVTAREYGANLASVYDWEGERFVLA